MTLAYCCSNQFLGWGWLSAGSMRFILNNAEGGTECLLNEWMDEWHSFLSLLDVSTSGRQHYKFPWHAPRWMRGWGVFMGIFLCQSLQLTKFPSRIQLWHQCMSQLQHYFLLIYISLSLPHKSIFGHYSSITRLPWVLFFFYSENSFIMLIALSAFWTSHLNCSPVSLWISEP